MSCIGAWQAAHGDLERLDRDVLLSRVLGLSRTQILTRPELPLTAADNQRLNAWARRRRDGEPLAYIIGSREFWGMEFMVNPAVLVPRPETELLVEVGLAFLDGQGEESRLESRSHKSLAALELGTGSGAVAIALATAASARSLELHVAATDVCERALQVAAANARRHAAAIEWLHGDWWQPVRGRFRLIISNPPYVRTTDAHLAALRHEPQLALTAGADGLEAMRRIIGGAAGHLDAGGMLALEHGWDQGGAVRELLHGAGFTDIATEKDLAGHERVSRARRARS